MNSAKAHTRLTSFSSFSSAELATPMLLRGSAQRNDHIGGVIIICSLTWRESYQRATVMLTVHLAIAWDWWVSRQLGTYTRRTYIHTYIRTSSSKKRAGVERENITRNSTNWWAWKIIYWGINSKFTGNIHHQSIGEHHLLLTYDIVYRTYLRAWHKKNHQKYKKILFINFSPSLTIPNAVRTPPHSA